MPMSKMLWPIHPAAAFVILSAAFFLFTFYSTLGTTNYSVRRLRPAARLRSKQDDMPPNIDIFSGIGQEFLPNFKNPCWQDRQGPLVKKENLFATWLKPASAAELVSYQGHNKRSYRLRCLPYFFLIGQPKCATTDVYQRINMHPDVAETLLKGPHWWTRRRYGQPYSPRPVTFMEYLDLFNGAAANIEASWVNATSTGVRYHQKITGDGSTSTLWDSSPTMNYLYSILNENSSQKVLQLLFAKREGLGRQNRHPKTMAPPSKAEENGGKREKNGGEMKDPEGCCFSSKFSVDDYNDFGRTVYRQDYSIQPGVVLPVTAADVIHAVLPKARIISVIREPASRLFSSYVFFTKKRQISPKDFDLDVHSSIRKWNDCTDRYAERTCAYNKTLQNNLEVRLYNGMYNIFLRDWLNVFPSEQLLVIRMEDYHQDVSATMASIYAHLGLRGLSEGEEDLVNTAPVQNKNKRKLKIGKMLNSTTKTLREFYAKYNEDLAGLLGDQKFTWEDYYLKA